MRASELLAEARALLDDVTLLDAHNDLAAELRRRTGGAVGGVASLDATFHTDLDRLRSGGVRAQIWSVFVPGQLSEPEAVVSVLEQIDLVRRMAAAHPGRLTMVTRAAEVEPATSRGLIASFLGVEGGHAIAGSLGVLRMLAALGVRTFTLTHNSSLAWADSATDSSRADGLDADGRAVVAELNRLGVVVDLSHTAPSTQRAALATSTAPVMFTHSGVAEVCAHPRNVSTELLRAVADAGGTLQLTFVPAFVSADRWAWSRAASAERARLGLPAHRSWPRSVRPAQSAQEASASFVAAHRLDPGPEEAWRAWTASHPAPPVTVSDVADHVDAARQLAGVRAVGLGGDFDGVDDMPVGLGDVSGYPRLFAELLSRGWSRADLGLLAGGNALRVLADAERASRS